MENQNAFVCDYELALASYWLNRVYSWFCHLAHRFSVRSLAVRPPFCFASCEFDLFSLQMKATLWNGNAQHSTAHNPNSSNKWINVPVLYWIFLRFPRKISRVYFIFTLGKIVFLHKIHFLVYERFHVWLSYIFALLCGCALLFPFFISLSSFHQRTGAWKLYDESIFACLFRIKAAILFLIEKFSVRWEVVRNFILIEKTQPHWRLSFHLKHAYMWRRAKNWGILPLPKMVRWM